MDATDNDSGWVTERLHTDHDEHLDVAEVVD